MGPIGTGNYVSSSPALQDTSRIDIEKNLFRSNGWAIKVQASCENNNFRQNNFTGNSFDVGTNGSVSLNEY